jgi:hypothetical protein
MIDKLQVTFGRQRYDPWQDLGVIGSGVEVIPQDTAISTGWETVTWCKFEVRQSFVPGTTAQAQERSLDAAKRVIKHQLYGPVYDALMGVYVSMAQRGMNGTEPFEKLQKIMKELHD